MDSAGELESLAHRWANQVGLRIDQYRSLAGVGGSSEDHRQRESCHESCEATTQHQRGEFHLQATDNLVVVRAERFVVGWSGGHLVVLTKRWTLQLR